MEKTPANTSESRNGLSLSLIDNKIWIVLPIVLLWVGLSIYSVHSHDYTIMAVTTPVMTVIISFYFGMKS